MLLVSIAKERLKTVPFFSLVFWLSHHLSCELSQFFTWLQATEISSALIGPYKIERAHLLRSELELVRLCQHDVVPSVLSHWLAILVPNCERGHRSHEIVQVEALVFRVQTLHRVVEILARLWIQLDFLLASHGSKRLVNEGQALLTLQNAGFVGVSLVEELS